MRRAALLALIALLPVSAVDAATTTVAVRITDRSIAFSPATVAVGTVRFVVRNAASRAWTLSLAGKRTRRLERGQRQVLTVTFVRAGTYRYTLSSPGLVGRNGSFRVTAPPPPPSPPPALPALTPVGEFEVPTDIDAPPFDERRVVVVQQDGLIHLLVDGELREQPFLDLRDRVRANGEAGLLSIAFAPDYAESGLLYVFYNGRDGNINIVEFRRDATDPERADPATARLLLRQIKFAANHNGGMLQFGPDGALYAAIGDGGSSSEVKPGALVQSPETVWGKILRFDLARGGRETWVGGLRNPWRFWIDAITGDAYIGDVGEDRREEIDLIPAGATGLDFGWPCFEGTLPFDEAHTCAGPAAPIYEYAHGEGACSITGGVVLRDPRLPTLEGAYLFADLCGGPIRALFRTVTGVHLADVGVSVRLPISFGVDGLGRAYVGSAEGAVYRIDPAA